MDSKTTQAKGDLVAFLNRNKSAGDRQPMFHRGRISKPGEEAKYDLTLWAFDYETKDGQIHTGLNGIIGSIPRGLDPEKQIEALQRSNAAATALTAPGQLDIKPHQIVLFVNPRAIIEPNKKHNKYYGFANFGDGSPIANPHVWTGTDKQGFAYLQGSTQYPLTKDELEEMRRAQQQVDAAAPDFAQPRLKDDAERKSRRSAGGRDR